MFPAVKHFSCNHCNHQLSILDLMNASHQILKSIQEPCHETFNPMLQQHGVRDHSVIMKVPRVNLESVEAAKKRAVSSRFSNCGCETKWAWDVLDFQDKAGGFQQPLKHHLPCSKRPPLNLYPMGKRNTIRKSFLTKTHPWTWWNDAGGPSRSTNSPWPPIEKSDTRRYRLMKT